MHIKDLKFSLIIAILNLQIEYSYSDRISLYSWYIDLHYYNWSSLTAFYVLVAHLSLAYVTKLVAYYIRVEDFFYSIFIALSLQYSSYVVNDFLKKRRELLLFCR